MQDVTDIVLWIIGGGLTMVFVLMGYLYKMINSESQGRREGIEKLDDKLDKKLESQDDRMRDSISYQQADQLIDLKMQPLKESLDRNTAAVTHLTEVLVKQGMTVK